MSGYVDRLIPDYHEQLGVVLKPFSIGHVFLMEKHNCEFIRGEAGKITVQDLILGLAICSRSYKEFLAFLDDPKGPRQTTDWGNKVMKMVDDEVATDKGEYMSPQWKRFSIYERFLKREAIKFALYMKQGIKEPRYIKEKEDSGDTWQGMDNMSHPFQNLRHLLITELNYNPETIMDVPVASAIADYYKHSEMQGAYTILEW